MKGFEDLTGKLMKIGKDRYLLLFLIGIMFVVIASVLETAEKQKAEKTQVTMDRGDGGSGPMDRGDGGSGPGADYASSEYAFGDGQSSVESGSLLYYSAYYEQHLEKMLEKMDGVGKVCVVVSLQSSEELILEKNAPYRRQTTDETRSGEQSKTTETESDSQVVFYENSDGRQVPIVVRRCAPTVKGIVVLAQGADRPGIREKISQLLVALFGIDEHKIKVAKYST